MRYLAANTPGFWLLAGVGFAVLAAQVLSLAIAIRQLRRVNASRGEAKASTGDQVFAIRLPTTWPCVVLSSTWLIVPAVAAPWVVTARAKLVANRMSVFHWLITAQPEIFSCAVAFAVPSAIIAAVTAAMALALRGHSRKVAALPLAFMVAVVFPFAAGIWSYSRGLVRAMYSVRDQSADTAASTLLPAMAHARLLLEFWAQLACAGLAMIAVVGALLVTESRQRDPRSPARSCSWLRVGLASALCLGVSIAIFSLGGPLRAENRTPWPPLADDVVGDWVKHHLGHVPVLAGPDRLARAPSLEISMRNDGHSDDVVVRVSSSGPIETTDALRERLRIERLNNPLLHPAGPHDILAVFCAPEVQVARLGALLSIAKDAGYRVFSFACVHNEETHRPILGSVARMHLTAVNASVESGARRESEYNGESVTIVYLGHHQTFSDLARRMAELRLVDQQVILDLDRSP
jgi:hypothetical protein